MIGNDIVDLALAENESNWQRKGFLDKIFTHTEQLFISSAENESTAIWNLWSRKEAAYKIYNRQTQIRGYFPLQLECFDLDCLNEVTLGKVRIKNQIYYTKTEINSDFVHTIAVENNRCFGTIKTLANRNNIQKTNGIPEYYEANSCSIKPVSISHHGRFTRIISL